MSEIAFAAGVRRVGDTSILELRGDLNKDADRALSEAYGQAAVQGVRRITLNFSAVDYINSTGIALIVSILAQARKSQREVTVYGLSEHYQEIFRITRLADFMTICPDERSALGLGA